jgi:hypothetical protein
MDTYVEPKFRTVKLRGALAVGAAAVSAAFGVGYALAQVTDTTDQATAVAPAAAVHTSNDAAADSLVLKQRSPLRGKAADIRYRRVQ